MNARIVLAACLILVLFPIVSNGEVWNLADDFSATQNPNGAWSFGWRETPVQPMILYVDNGRHYCDGEILDALHSSISDPEVISAIRTTTRYLRHFYPRPPQGDVPPRPGPAERGPLDLADDQDVTLAVHFASIDTGSKIVYIYVNGTSMFWTYLEAIGQTANYATTLDLLAGDVIDCAIDQVSFYGDSTQLDVVLETTEPTPVAERTWGQIKATYK